MVLQVHAFAEEMNKCRRMCALQSRALADAGFAVLQIDLLGCGDSSGGFGDASWDAWSDDIVHAAGWLARQHDAPLLLWGVRAGCLLLSAAGARLGRPTAALFWQPVVSGKVALQQFLRLRVASGLLDGESRGVGEQLRQDLAAGRSVDVAGYLLSAALANGLEAALLLPWAGLQRCSAFEVSLRDNAVPSPALASTLARWQASAVDCDAQTLHGPAFWQSTEIEVAPALIAATVAAAQRGAVA